MKLDAFIILASIASVVAADVPHASHNSMMRANNDQPSLADSLFSMRGGAGM